jgi:hypothetical protein
MSDPPRPARPVHPSLASLSGALIICACLLGVLPSCGSKQPAQKTDTAIEAARDTVPARTPAPELKRSLAGRLAAIRTSHDNGPSGADLRVLIHAGNSLVHTLAITAEALDRDRSFAADIGRALTRLDAEHARRSDEAGRMLNSMTGMYEMYDILARMKFRGDTASERAITDLHTRTMRALAGETVAMNSAARMAGASYELTGMIMREIDSRQLFAASFDKVQGQFRRGARLAKSQEDHFLNGVYRTYEMSQLWLLALDPSQKDAIASMNDGFREAAGRSAENLGMQLTAAVEFLYRISLLIADRTVQITL